MNAQTKTPLGELPWDDSFSIGELKKLISLMGEVPLGQAEGLHPTSLLRMLHVRASAPKQKEPAMATETLPRDGSIRAILWDNDGVLVDSESAYFSLTKRVFRDHRLDLDKDRWAKEHLGLGLRTEAIAEKMGKDSSEAIRMATHRDILWRQQLKDPMPLVPNVAKVVETLAKRYRMAVVSSDPREIFVDIHRFTGILRHFETTITFDDCPRIKPEPDAYLMAAARMGLHPSECLVVEDTPRGVSAAVKAGMRSVVIGTPLTDLSQCQDATWIIPSVKDLEKVLVGETVVAA